MIHPMRKPHVLRPQVYPSLGKSSARFATEILARYAPDPDSQLYPEAWLVFREEEEREREQAAGTLQLTQLTIRLALQLVESFSAGVREERTIMEENSLRETLRTCLTALESRDRETCQELRQLTRLFQLGGEKRHTVATERKEWELVREQLLRRLEQVDWAAGRADQQQLRNTQAALKPEAQPDEGAGKPAEKVERKPVNVPPMSRSRPFVTAMGRLPANLWRGTVRSSMETISLLSRRQSVSQRVERALREHKERFLQILSQAETREQEEIWRLVEEHTQLTIHHRQQWTEDFNLTAEEKLERLVRESSHREYTSLLQTLERQIRYSVDSQVKHPSIQAAVSSADRVENKTLARQAAPLLSWLDQALQQSRVQRKAMLAEMQAAPEPVWRAFLALAEASGAFHMTKKQGDEAEETQAASWERLTFLTRESRRQELETLSRWTKTLLEQEEKEIPPKNQSRQPKPQWTKGTVGKALERFLIHERREYRRELLQILSAARPAEREALLTGLLELAGDDASRPESAEGERAQSGKILRLLEHSADPVRLLEQVKSTRAFQRVEATRTKEQTVLERLNIFTQGRGSTWEAESTKLTQGLDGEERKILQKHLRMVQELRQPSEDETAAVPVPQAEQQTLLSALTFRTQKEYKSFRYHLTRYLMGQTPPPEPLLAEVTRWAEDRQRQETLELIRTEVPLVLERTEKGPEKPKKEGSRNLPHLVSAMTGPRWRESQPAVSFYRRPENDAGPVLRLSSKKTEQRKSPAFMISGGPIAIQAELPEPAGRQTEKHAELTDFVINRLTGKGESIQAIQITHKERRRLRETQSLREVSLMGETILRRNLAALALPDKMTEQPGTLRLEGTVRNLPQTDRFTSITVSTESIRKEIAYLHPASRAAKLSGSSVQLSEAPQLELRRDRAPEAVRETAARAAEERVTLAVQRQAPELHLLRRQNQEQERALEQQRKDLGALKKRLEQQETMVQKVVENARIPGLEEPAQTRRLAKAVMKELEGQLRLERQRRGWS